MFLFSQQQDLSQSAIAGPNADKELGKNDSDDSG